MAVHALESFFFIPWLRIALGQRCSNNRLIDSEEVEYSLAISSRVRPEIYLWIISFSDAIL